MEDITISRNEEESILPEDDEDDEDWLPWENEDDEWEPLRPPLQLLYGNDGPLCCCPKEEFTFDFYIPSERFPLFTIYEDPEEPEDEDDEDDEGSSVK